MGGFVSGDATDFRSGAKKGKKAGERLKFIVTIRANDLGAFLKDPAHSALMTGTIDSSSLGPGRKTGQGEFNLFQEDEQGRKRMRYRLPFEGSDGAQYVLEGYKAVENDRAIDFWYDTTALFTTVRRAGTEGTDGIISRGILRIRPIDLVPQVISMRGLNTRNPLKHALAVVRFNLFFFIKVFGEYALRLPRRRRSAPAA
jgi:cholesterol oxidase